MPHQQPTEAANEDPRHCEDDQAAKAPERNHRGQEEEIDEADLPALNRYGAR
jgi:hypothetical protein